MQLYQFKLRLNSNVNNEVLRFGTVPEIIVLRLVHSMAEDIGGYAPVENIKLLPGQFKTVSEPDPDNPGKIRSRPISEAEERDYLRRQYGGALRKHRRYKDIDAVFGPAHTPLPQVTEGIEDIVDPKGKIKRTRVARKDKGDDVQKSATHPDTEMDVGLGALA